MSKRWLLAILACVLTALAILFIANLGRTGFLGPDEPRYASIGREMARSGDWITPRLDGKPWFEKPPLLYWMTALGFLVHLPDELAARLPQTLLAFAFLTFFYQILVHAISARVALFATAILATSIGWLVYSFVALTDLPMSATLDAAVLLTIFGGKESSKTGWLTGALLGFSILGKGFVPVALFAPLLLLLRGRRSFAISLLMGTLIVAAPWYVLCFLHNGSAFWDDFFWKQHVARFLTPVLEHVQPFWFYLPVLLGGLFPWTPLAGLLANHKIYQEARVRILSAWVLYGFIFFSAARNKLPGYLLPLMPAVAVILAVALDRATKPGIWLALCGLMLMVLPTAAHVLPAILQNGLRRTNIHFLPVGIIYIILASAAWWLAARRKIECAALAVAMATAITLISLMGRTMPVLDRNYSARGFYKTTITPLDGACLTPSVSRALEYGLNYYVDRPLNRCFVSGADLGKRIVLQNGELRVETP